MSRFLWFTVYIISSDSPLTLKFRRRDVRHFPALGWTPLNLAKYSSCEWALLKRFPPRSEVKGKVHDQTKCHNGGGMHYEAHLSVMNEMK